MHDDGRGSSGRDPGAKSVVKAKSRPAGPPPPVPVNAPERSSASRTEGHRASGPPPPEPATVHYKHPPPGTPSNAAPKGKATLKAGMVAFSVWPVNPRPCLILYLLRPHPRSPPSLTCSMLCLLLRGGHFRRQLTRRPPWSVCLAHRHPLCQASLHRAPPDGAAELPTLRRWTKRSWRRTDWGHRKGSTTGEMWLRCPLRCKGLALARSPLCLTLPFKLGGVLPRQSHEIEAEVAIHGRGRMVQRLALTKRRSIGLRFLLWDRPRSASMFGLHHGSRRTPGQTPPRMPRKHSGQRFCKGGPSSNTGQTLPFVHHDTMTSRYAQSWDIRVTDFPDPFCTPACWLYVHLSSSFSANALRVPQVLEATALCVGRSASGSAHLWASTRMHHESQCFHLFSFVLSAASTSNCLQSEASQALRVAGSIFRPWRQWLHYAALAISLDVRNSAHVGLICTLTYRYLSHVAVVCAGLRLSISVPVPLPWIAQCHPHSALLPVGPVFPDLPKGRAGSASAVVG